MGVIEVFGERENRELVSRKTKRSMIEMEKTIRTASIHAENQHQNL